MSRQNLCTNPAAKNNVTGWGGNGSAPTRSTGLSGFPDRTTGISYTSGTFIAGPTISVTAGDTWTISIYARSNNFNTNSGNIYLQWSGGGSTSAAYTLTAGVVKRISVTGTVPGGNTTMQIIVDGQNFASSSYDVTECLYEKVGALDTYFDGDTVGAVWDGTDGNSSSTLSGTTPIASSDTGAGTEAISALSVTTTSTETGAGTEATSSLLATTTATETGTGTEATSALSATTSSTETSTGTEATSSLSATTSSSDTSTGTDAQSLAAALTSSETASATESAQIGIPSSDTAAASESSLVGLSGTDTATGSETALITVFSADSAGGTELETALSAQLSAGETAAGTDTQASSAGLVSSDTGTAAESSSLDTGSGISIVSTDSATATDTQSLHVSITTTEQVTATDQISVAHATLSSTDVATATDTGGVGTMHAVSDADVAAGVETEARSAVPNSRKVHVYPYYIRESQSWAVEQERRRHNQALWMVGETTMFALMWHIEDFQNGLVERCRTCYDSQGAISDVYGQSDQNKCLDCFGTTFDGGFKAIIIRPAIFSDTDEGETFHGRGVIHPNDLAIESTPDFRVRNGDYCFRATGERYYLRVPERITLRTGYGLPTQQDMAIGYNHSNAQVEDPTAVSYLIPPPQDEVNNMLRRVSRIPRDWSSFETIRAPLIPSDLQAPDA